MSHKPVRVLVVDDSALVRKVMTRGLGADPDIEVVAAAVDPFDARDKIVSLRPEVMTLDVEMPKMDGVEFLRRLMAQLPLPTIIVSSLTRRGTQTALAALGAGAIDVVAKPTADVAGGLERMMLELRAKVKNARYLRLDKIPYEASAPPCRPPSPARPGLAEPATPTGAVLEESSHRVVAIGASTGGTQALARVMERLPVKTPGVVIVQHMPPSFTGPFAARLDRLSPMRVEEARDGDRVMDGLALVAPGGKQLEIERRGAMYYARVRPGPLVSGHCPSVDVMMASIAKAAGRHAMAVMLTGMGDDGAKGMLAMRRAGAHTVGQDERSCVVYGMPRVAYELGAVERQVPLDGVADAIRRYAQRPSS
ncbi:MAG: chemotaxis response regulator protein-glutamate methylesterase [Proteobacteria bacterium]|nr:MAG: chemotaxis response regulator protein-glutamate methylesterase [Pseudomonadota bacterium]